jgi:hypothetical protein
MALLTALFATALLMALGLSTLLLGSGETSLAYRDRDVRALAYASHAAATLAEADLLAMPASSWPLLGTAGAVTEMSAAPGSFVDSTLTPSAPWDGSPLDLRALTADLQQVSDAAAPSGGPAPPWRLLEYGPLRQLVPSAGSRNPYYLVVWVSDQAGVLAARAVAYGPGDGRSITEISVLRQTVPEGPDRLRVLTVRPGT